MIVPVLVIVLIVIFGVVLLVTQRPLPVCKSSQYQPKVEEPIKKVNMTLRGAAEVNRLNNAERVAEENNAVHKDYRTETDMVEEVQLPPENTRRSVIEPMHELPTTVGTMLVKTNSIKNYNNSHPIQSHDVSV